MSIRLSVFSATIQQEQKIVEDLQNQVGNVQGIIFESYSKRLSENHEPGNVILLDGLSEEKLRHLDQLLEKLDRKGRALILLIDQSMGIPQALAEGKIDDLLVFPFRALDLFGRLHHYQRILMWDEVNQINASFGQLISSMHEDLKLAENLQKAKLPQRFDQIKGFKLASRYLAGYKSGGDYFDLAESKDGQTLSLLLSDSSSYGLSSAVLAVLMKVAMKLSVEESRSCVETVKKIYDEIVLTLKVQDHLSLFYGSLSRRDLKLRYLSLGFSKIFRRAGRGSAFECLESQGPPLTKMAGFPKILQQEIVLSPGDRLVLCSDGFVEAAGGEEGMLNLLSQKGQTEAVDTLNELAYRVKSKLVTEEDLPTQDCTGIVLDVDSNVLRLA